MKLPVVVISGPTGVGKSNFSINLCKCLLKHKINAEVVNADSMQVYKNFTIGTAKATKEEQQGVPHHLLDICDDFEEYSMHKYYEDATQTINKLHQDGTLPVVVGGSYLFIECLLLESIFSTKSYNSSVTVDATEIEAINEKIRAAKDLTAPEAYSLLSEIDPIRAKQLHANDYRRVLRSIEIYYQTNTRHSNQLRNARNTSEEQQRYNSLVLWIDCESEGYKRRVSERVSSMLRDGLLNELFDLREKQRSNKMVLIKDDTNEKLDFDYSKGVYQSIAYKEFSEILENPQIKNISDIPPDSLERCKQQLIRKTLGYAKRQRRWFKNTLKTQSSPNLHIHEIAAGDGSEWDDATLESYAAIINDFLKAALYPPNYAASREPAS